MAAGEHDGDPGHDGSNTTGFVSPAADALEGPFDPAALLDLRRPHRYPVRVLGEALVDRGIYPGDALSADTAATGGGAMRRGPRFATAGSWRPARAGRRFWLFRQGGGLDPATGSLAWFLHGFL